MQIKINRYNRRIYTSPRQFMEAIADILRHTDDLKNAARSKRIDHSFAEKIMLAVTQVNGCRYCHYGHTKTALRAGVSPKEIARISAGDLGDFPEDEAIALFFGQHYAETGGNPDAEAFERLENFYGEKRSRDILVYIRMIMFGNLMGNTFDAFLSRLRGNPSLDGSLISELAILSLSVIGFFPFGIIMALRMF
jgi:AhpD family alkylhydroperoxidase